MELRVQGRNVEVTQSVREHIEKKVHKLGRHLPTITEVAVELRWEPTRAANHRAVVEVTVNVNGTLLRGEERAPTFQAAMDTVADVLDRRLLRYKGRIYRSEQARKTGKASSLRRLEAEQANEALEASVEGPGPVVRVKRFSMKPTAVAEAIQQMENLGHSFFLFLNADSGELNLLYRRSDGGYGIIEPQLP